MNKILLILSFLISLVYLTSQSWALPPCSTSGYFDNCYGSFIYKKTRNKYVGEWKNNLSHGTGNKTYYNGDIFSGEWKNGKKHGKGTYIFGLNGEWTGEKYIGEFKDDIKHGQGRYTYADGRVKEGIWKNDKFQYVKKKPTPILNPKIEEYKSFCSDIGFTPGTEKFGECVVEVMKKG